MSPEHRALVDHLVEKRTGQAAARTERRAILRDAVDVVMRDLTCRAPCCAGKDVEARLSNTRGST